LSLRTCGLYSVNQYFRYFVGSVYLSIEFCFALLCCLYSEHEIGAEEKKNDVKEQTYNFLSHICSVAMLLAQHF